MASEIFSAFHEHMISVFNECCPEIKQQFKINQCNTNCPTPEIKTNSNIVEVLRIMATTLKTSEAQNMYRKYKLELQSQAQLEQRLRNSQQIWASDNTQKTTWNIYNNNELHHNKKNRTEIGITADQFSDYLVSLNNTITSEDHDLNKGMRLIGNGNSCFMKPTDSNEIRDILKTLKNKRTLDI